MTNVIDVAVIGGGPAGASAARLLAAWSRSVLLVARQHTRLPLAESLPPSCTKLFDQIGVRQAVDDAGFVRATGNTVYWGAADERVEPFPAGARGYQVARDAFDTVLVGAAQDCGARVENRAIVRRVERAADRWTVTLDSKAGTSLVNARCVLDCSGRAGIVARDGWRRPATGARTLAVIGVWEREDGWPGLPDESQTLVESYEGGWAWSVPVSSRKRYVTVMVDPALTELPGRPKLADAYDVELGRTRRLRNLVNGAVRCVEPFARDASPYTADQFGEIGVLLVGDAASFVDPLSSYGVKKALASAWLASVVVNTWLTEPTLGDAALKLFAARERAMYRHLQQQAGTMARAAADAHASEFWTERADTWSGLDGELDVEDLRGDPRVRSAFEELKRRPSARLRWAPQTHVTPRATVRGDRVVMEDGLTLPGSEDGVRYARNVDLLRLARIAEQHDQVPDMFAAYNRGTQQAALPDFLGALSTLVGLEMLVFA